MPLLDELESELITIERVHEIVYRRMSVHGLYRLRDLERAERHVEEPANRHGEQGGDLAAIC